MAAMSRNNSVESAQGFSVYQPALGAALQFFPAVGTQQLSDLINAYLPGPASLKEKRATIAMDFCEFSEQTGESFKYYPVYTIPFGSAMDSSTSSSPLMDSNFVSPVISDWSWSQSTPASASVSTPSSSVYDLNSSRVSGKASKQPSNSGPRSQPSDFSHIPGMKIMTKDGQDVTNSASRGCKTKEQRDHAHLMRIIKACDACRKKKIRCDPSHKKRTASQSQSQPQAKPAKKARHLPREPQFVSEAPRSSKHSSTAPSFAVDPAFADDIEIQDYSAISREPWESFVQYDDEPMEIVSFDYDFFFDPEGHISPQSGFSSASPSQPLTPAQPAEVLLPYDDWSNDLQPDGHQPTLPYLDHAGSATNYIDFNLYSPASSFLDEDPMASTDIGTSGRREQNANSGVSLVDWERHRSSRSPRHEQYLVDGQYSPTRGDAGSSPGFPAQSSQAGHSSLHAIDRGWAEFDVGEFDQEARSYDLTSYEGQSAPEAMAVAKNRHGQLHYAQSTSARTQVSSVDSRTRALQTMSAVSATSVSSQSTEDQRPTVQSLRETSFTQRQFESAITSGTQAVISSSTISTTLSRETILHNSGDSRSLSGVQHSPSASIPPRATLSSAVSGGSPSGQSVALPGPVLTVRRSDIHVKAIDYSTRDHVSSESVRALSTDGFPGYSPQTSPVTVLSTTASLLPLFTVIGSGLLQTLSKKSGRSGTTSVSPSSLVFAVLLAVLCVTATSSSSVGTGYGVYNSVLQILLGLALYSGYHWEHNASVSGGWDSLAGFPKTPVPVARPSLLTNMVGSIKVNLRHVGQQLDNIRCRVLRQLSLDSDSGHGLNPSRRWLPV